MQKIVIVLNADFSFLNIVEVERAFLYIAKGKVIVEKYSESCFNTAEAVFKIPKIVRFVHFVKQIYKKTIPWSKRNVLIRDKYTCQYCGKASVDHMITIDHIMPKSRGGQNSFENTVAACFECNNSKDDRTPHEAGMSLRCAPRKPTVSEFIAKTTSKLNIAEIFEGLATA